ncbi:restriction endonuclease [Pleurocapsales cyanobacterium LEGE 10410]|nr:restriction endonuclease [Pleurocapsales cyanobacterium LEGE 10410]
MPIPDYQAIMLPLLKFAGDKQEHSLSEAAIELTSEFNLTEDEKNELLPSGGEGRFYNRVSWARTYLKKAGLLSYPRRGFFSITSKGEQLLANPPEAINAKFLKRYDEFVRFIEIKSNGNLDNKEDKVIVETPEEILESAHQKLLDNLSGEILENIKKCSPYFFEYLVVDLLVSMGYGGSRKEAGQAVGKSGDEGIDGIIKEDRLGLDIIYIQAKRWDNVVGRPEIQKFAGALLGQSAKKGIFITTSDFTKGAVDYVTRIDSKIILVNGNRLAELMIEHDIGVTPIARYEVKRIDSDYFIED